MIHPERVLGLVLVGTGARLRVAPAILDGLLDDIGHRPGEHRKEKTEPESENQAYGDRGGQ